MLFTTAFTLTICTVLFLIAGMINPSWALFWMDKPSRLLVIFISTIMFMGTFTLYGEAMKRKAESDQSSDVQQVKTEESTE